MSTKSRMLAIIAVGGLAAGALLMPTAVAQQPAQQPAPNPTPRPTQPAPSKPLLEVGMQAPEFLLMDTDGNTVRLADFEERIVVIEWLHPGCEEARSLHVQGAIPALVKAYEAEDIAWIGVNAVPKTEKFGGTEASLQAMEDLNITYPVLVDETGLVAKMYEATRSPSVTVIDAEGIVRYIGAVDNAPNGKLPEGVKRVNYLDQALHAIIDGTKVEIPRTTPQGCEIRPAKPAKPG